MLALAFALPSFLYAAPVPVAPAAKAANPGHAAGQVLPWIEDDHTRAVAEAKARRLPLFVESWAPW